MTRLARFLLVTLLAFSASGATELIVTDDCPLNETAATHQTCAPTCARCRCCFQAIEVAGAPPAISATLPIATGRPLRTALSPADAREILHVPKQSLL